MLPATLCEQAHRELRWKLGRRATEVKNTGCIFKEGNPFKVWNPDEPYLPSRGLSES